jgi:hypothetical protein
MTATPDDDLNQHSAPDNNPVLVKSDTLDVDADEVVRISYRLSMLTADTVEWCRRVRTPGGEQP